MSVTDRLPDLSRPVTPRQYSRIAPLAFGCGILPIGALLSRTRPSALDLPDVAPRRAKPQGPLDRALAWTRDEADEIAPENMVSQLGRSLMIAGGTMLAARVLDELAGRR